jgi:hypothetical protein
MKTWRTGHGRASQAQPRTKKLNPKDSWEEACWQEALIRDGLAELIPRKQRGRPSLVLRLILLLLGCAGLLGLPLVGVAFCLLLALALEAVSHSRRERVSWPLALVRPSFWERSRPSFYWTLAVAVGFVSLLFAGEAFPISLLRAGFEWLCFRGIEDSIQHPERYRSVWDFLSWLTRLGEQVVHAWDAWLSFVAFAITASLVLDLSAPGIWASVGNTAWNRLLLFVGGLCLISLLIFLRTSKSVVLSAVAEGLQDWAGPQASDLDGALRSACAASSRVSPGSDYVERLEEQLGWKCVDHLVARIRSELVGILTQRVRWNLFLTSSSAFLLTLSFLAIAVYLIVPRTVVTDWVSTGQTSTQEIALAFDDLQEFDDLSFIDRLLGLKWSDLAQEPLPKVIFLEAAIVVFLGLFRSATDRSILKRMSSLEPANVRRWLLLGTAYLTLAEKEFQQLYSGFVTREWSRDGALKTMTLRNEVLLAPFAKKRSGAYRAISGFLQIYEPLERNSSAYLVAVFGSCRVAQEWTVRFLQFPAVGAGQPGAVDQKIPAGPESASRRFWIWSGGQVLDLTSFEEAQQYVRVVAR